jgi:RNA polymerase sigma factor (sigma-70 family)
MELTNEQKNYVITFETAVQRLVMNMPNIHVAARMDVVRYITEWLLRRPQFFTSHTPLHLARAVTRTRAIDYIRQQARQSAERTWNDIDKCFVGNVALDEMMVQISASDASSYEEALNPESIFFTKMSREIIDQALIKHLTKKHYDVFTLRAFEEFNVNEIAALTSSKHYNVSRLYTQAQKRLRKVYVANPEELGL